MTKDILAREEKSQRQREAQLRLHEARIIAERKRSRLDTAPSKDMMKALDPDFKNAFGSRIDAWQRLLPFHCLYSTGKSDCPDAEWEKRRGEVVEKYAKRAIKILDDTNEVESRFMVAGDFNAVKGAVIAVRSKKPRKGDAVKEGSGESKQKPDSLMTANWDGSEDSEEDTEMNDDDAVREKTNLKLGGVAEVEKYARREVEAIREENGAPNDSVNVFSSAAHGTGSIDNGKNVSSRKNVEEGDEEGQDVEGGEGRGEGREDVAVTAKDKRANGVSSPAQQGIESLETQLSLTDDLFVQRLLLADERSLIPPKPVTRTPAPAPKFQHLPIDFRPAVGVMNESRSLLGMGMRPGVDQYGRGQPHALPQIPMPSAWNGEEPRGPSRPHFQQQFPHPLQGGNHHGQSMFMSQQQHRQQHEQHQQPVPALSKQVSPGRPLPSIAMSVGPVVGKFGGERSDNFPQPSDSRQTAGASSAPGHAPFSGYDPLPLPSKAMSVPGQRQFQSLPIVGDNTNNVVRLPPLDAPGNEVAAAIRSNLSNSQNHHQQLHSYAPSQNDG